VRQDAEAGQAVSEAARDPVRNSQVESCHTHRLLNRIRRMGASSIARIEMTVVVIGMTYLFSLNHS
jgi:hypothetical protein